MRQTPDYAPNYYRFETPEECVVALNEHREKQEALHEARMRANAQMRHAIAEHEFLVRCTDKAREEELSLHHRMQTLVQRRAQKMVAAAAVSAEKETNE